MVKPTVNVIRGLMVMMDLGLIMDHPDDGCLDSKQTKQVDAANRWLEKVTDAQRKSDGTDMDNEE